MRWQDVVDIALVSYILLRFYVLFRGTAVFRGIAGLAFLWIFQRIPHALGLVVTSWAVQGIITVAAFIIIVVYRNELRSVFQAKNFKNFLWGFPHKSGKTPIEIISKSAFELARKRIGALIVFPGKNDLEDVVQSGIPWQGLVTPEMISSIFWHDNPVHDGAAIVQGNRITEVGVILPLSRRQDLPSYYGTRHRAAAGLAEATDALVLIISEEREKVVVAKGSNFQEVKSVDELEDLLREHVGETTIPMSRRVNDNIRYGIAALVSILFVTTVWFSFTKGLDTLIALDIPVEYVNRDPSMEIVDASVNTVSLQLGGSGALIKSIRPDQVRLKLDLSQAVVGPNTYTINQEEVTLPPGVILKMVKPKTVEVTLDVLAQKELPVQVDWVGELPRQLIMESVQLKPEIVTLVGPNQILKNILTAYTQKVTLDKIFESGTLTVGLALNHPSLKVAPNSKDKIEVSYVVKERSGWSWGP
jgi:diadenylate cyclase